MGGNFGNQLWVTYAGNDTEAKKCVGLARSLKRTLTTRPIGVIISETVSTDMSRRLQSEFQVCHRIEPSLYQSNGTPMQFRSVAKIYAQQLPQQQHIVFLDCNCLVLQNVDDIFHQHGVQWVTDLKGLDFAAVVVNSRSTRRAQRKRFMKMIISRENIIPKNIDTNELDDKKYLGDEIRVCIEVDLSCKHPCPLTGDALKIICFVNGSHPVNSGRAVDVGESLKTDLFRFWESLHTPIINGYNDMGHMTLLEDSTALNNSIAIVGMACKYPGANSITEFWKLLENGIDGVVKVPEWRWTKDSAYIMMDDVRSTEAGFLSCPINLFDAKFFNTNQADMAYLDPQQRLVLKVVWEALEHARIDPARLKNSLTGVFGGYWRNDYKEMLQQHGFEGTDFLRGYMGNALGPLTARISHFFELIGPAISTESGCSTSITGVDMACEALRNETANLCIAVGVNLLLHPFPLIGGLMEGVLAPDGRCKTFDSAADGFGRAEGAGVLILKRYPDAVADGDKIWGLIRGTAVVQEGISRSMGTPTVAVEAKAMELALERAGVDPDDVEFLEVHGTGTPVGDPIEVAAICKVYGGRDDDNILTLASVKTNIGHTESVCGIASIQKTVLSMANQLIPRHLHLQNLNPDIDLSSIPARIPIESIAWNKNPDRARIAGVNSFGITGAQAHVIIQEPPGNIKSNPVSLVDDRGLKIFTFSAKTEISLHAQIEMYKDLFQDGGFNLGDLEYTMHTGRSHFQIRQAIIGATNEELLSSIANSTEFSTIPNSPLKICFLFTGQGSQYPSMCKELYETSIVFRSNFDFLESILSLDYGFSIKNRLWGLDTPEKSSLTSTLHSQTAIFCVEMCLLRLWESWGVKPDAVLGHSLGEFVAFVAAGIMDVTDALKLVVSRSKLIDALPEGGMMAVFENEDKVVLTLEQSGLDKILDVAAVNSPNQTVISGDKEALKRFKLFCVNNGLKTHDLDSAHAFHSKQMDPILGEYANVAATIQFKNADTNITFISGVEGKQISRIDPDYLKRHTGDKVRFNEASLAAAKEGFHLFLEVGPHPVLSSLVLTNLEANNVMALPSVRKNISDWKSMLSTLENLYKRGVPINWENFHRFTSAEKTDLPGYVFDETPYWINIKDDGTTPFHPLLGSYVPNATEATIFQSSVNVNRLQFLKDHMLGDRIIFPCAGFLDMCLTAGFAALSCEEGKYEKPTGSIGVNNFSIVLPVCLSDIQSTDFQAVVSKSPEGETTSTIYSRLYLDKCKYKWCNNASANFDFNPTCADNSLINFMEIKKRINEEFGNNFSYNQLEQFGFNFGPSLHTISERRWRNPDVNCGEFLFTFKCHETEENMDRFILHPWIIDAMLQGQMLGMGLMMPDENIKTMKQLIVPIQIEKFVWRGSSSASGYIYTKLSKGYNEAHLYDEKGVLMASMIGTEFMETTLNNILALIDSQKNPLPQIAEYTWKEKLGPRERRVPLHENESTIQELLGPVERCVMTSEEISFNMKYQKYSGLCMLKAMKELGLGNNTTFSWPNVVETLQVLPSLDKFVRYILLELTTDGYLLLKDDQDRNAPFLSFSLPQPFPPLQTIQSMLDAIIESSRAANHPWTDTLTAVSPLWLSLSQILTGHQSALQILFESEANSKSLTERFYAESFFSDTIRNILPVGSSLLKSLASLAPKSVVRVLEIGAGVGGFTVHILKGMLEVGASHYEYTYTDISPAFLQKGEIIFQDTEMAVNFALLDIEQDPMSQGFAPHQYDLINIAYVLHATKNLEQSVANVAQLLKPGGYVTLMELNNQSRDINLTFGGVDAFWRFEDFALRPWNCELDADAWCDLFTRHGFNDHAIIRTPNEGSAVILAQLGLQSQDICPIITNETNEHPNMWLIFGGRNSTTTNLEMNLKSNGFSSKLVLQSDLQLPGIEMEEEIRNLISSNIKYITGVIYMWGMNTSTGYRATCEPFLYICKYLANISVATNFKVITITTGCMCTSDTDYCQAVPEASPLVAMVQVLANENVDIRCKAVDIDFGNQVDEELLFELFHSDLDTMVAYRNCKRFTPRIKKYNQKSASLDIPRSPCTRLIVPATHLISDIYFTSFEPAALKDDEILVEVKAYSLNFLDVLMATKPDPVFDTYNSLGMDISGIVRGVGAKCSKRKVGDRVIVFRRAGDSLPSHIVVNDSMTIEIPRDFTFSDAATLSIGSITVCYSLVSVARAKPDDIILIHTASGGVGLLGIQLAKRIGCTIIVTAGTTRKRNYLKTLGLKHVFNSRSTEYEQDIRKVLGGNKVTIVLNSITGEGFKEATLSVCQHGARFVEISKMNIWSKKDVHELRPDVEYYIVDLSTLPVKEFKILGDELGEQVHNKMSKPKPLPYVKFESKDIRSALEYVEKAKHVGKVVITMPHLEKGCSEPKYKLFNYEATYLITGGFGGIGLEVAKWMVESGASNLLLVGRSPPNATALQTIEILKKRKINVIMRYLDIGNFEELNRLFTEINSAPEFYPIRGIMHAAGVLDDGTWEKQTWDKFENAFRAKVEGSWNLHYLSCQLDYPLEHFVAFSSMTSTFGAAGQGNYSAANYYLDALIHYRKSIGLTGLTINWGQWGQVGLAAHITHPIFKPFTIHQGVAALELALKSRKTQLVAYEADLSALKKVLVSTRGLLADIEDAAPIDMGQIDGEVFWIEYDAAESGSEKLDVIRKFITRIIRVALKMHKTEVIDEDAHFQDLGMDSLMMVELKNGLQASVGKRVKISLHAVKDCKTVKELSTRLVELISGEENVPILSTEELIQLAENDSKLSDTIAVDDSLLSTLCPINDVTTVLLTGASGTLGPYILRELREKYPSVEKVYCLMRPNPFLSHEDRFNRVMHSKNLLSGDQLSDWVEPVPGDVGKEMMGLNATTYSKLCSEVDAVIHLAVKVSYDEKYNSTQNYASCRMVNVQGLKNILEFAASEKLKHVFHASTTGAQTELGEDGIYSESWPNLNQIRIIPNSAYLISKLICELLIEQAIQRGVPCKMFRMTNIGGDSVVGGNVQLDNFLMIRFLSYMYLGFMPAHNVPLCMMTVDLCAEFSMRLFFSEDATLGVYNIMNPDIGDEREFDEIAEEFGVTVDVLEPDDFVARLKSLDDKDPMYEFVKQVLEYEKEMQRAQDDPLPFYLPWLQGNKNITWSKKLAHFIPDVYPSKIMSSWDVLRKDLTVAKNDGIFDRYHIKYKP